MRASLATVVVVSGLLLAASSRRAEAQAGCVSDSDCNGDRVCEQGSCVAPPSSAGGTEAASGESSSPPAVVTITRPSSSWNVAGSFWYASKDTLIGGGVSGQLCVIRGLALGAGIGALHAARTFADGNTETWQFTVPVTIGYEIDRGKIAMTPRIGAAKSYVMVNSETTASSAKRDYFGPIYPLVGAAMAIRVGGPVKFHLSFDYVLRSNPFFAFAGGFAI